MVKPHSSVTKSVALGAALWVGPFIAGTVLVSLAANQQDRQSESKSRDEDKPLQTPERLVAPGIENAFRLSPRLYSGGEPQGEGAFKALKALGVKTIISVDGARPDVETARKFGIRYVHLPVGYHGVPRAGRSARPGDKNSPRPGVHPLPPREASRAYRRGRLRHCNRGVVQGGSRQMDEAGRHLHRTIGASLPP